MDLQNIRPDYRAAALAALVDRRGRHALRSPQASPLGYRTRPYILAGGVA